MSRWFELYRLGERVEVLFPFATGSQWTRGYVARKTVSGYPVVNVQAKRGVTSLVVDRKSAIRRESARAS